MTVDTIHTKTKPPRYKSFPESLRSRKPLEFFLFVILLVCVHFYTLFRFKHALTPLDGWPKHISRNVSHYIDTEIGDLPDGFCKYPTTLLVIVHSTPKGKASRDAIRRTWGNHSILVQHNASLYFLLGQDRNFNVQEQIAEENEEHHDVIVQDFIDSYANLTLKSVTMLKLFRHRSHQCQYLAKADEDVFLNVENLVAKINKWRFHRFLLLGRLVEGERRKNNYYKRWYAPRYMYLPHTYPPFLTGPAYLMSLGAGRVLYKAALEMPLFHLEDVFLTGICAERVGITRHNDRHFTDFGIPRNRCMRVKMVSAHSFPPAKLLQLQKLYIREKRDNATCKENRARRKIPQVRKTLFGNFIN